MYHPRLHNQRGFTLIEMIVSLGVFAVVVTITTGALITLIATNQRFQREQNTTTNLAFALDSMSREIRTGYNYYCASATTPESPFTGTHENPNGTVQDGSSSALKIGCYNGRPGNSRFHGISFYEGGDSITGPGVRRILYYYDADHEAIYRRVGDGPSESIISDDIAVVRANIYVTDVNSLDTRQPTVTLHIEARDRADDNAERYVMQTTVTQRSLDI